MALEGTSPPLIVLVGVAAAATGYAWICAQRADRVARQALFRIQEEHPVEWNKIPTVIRRFARASVAIRVLRGKADAQLIHEEWEEIRRLDQRTIAAVIVGISSVLAALAGSRAFGWNWG